MAPPVPKAHPAEIVFAVVTLKIAYENVLHFQEGHKNVREQNIKSPACDCNPRFSRCKCCTWGNPAKKTIVETTQKKANDVSELTNTNTLYLCVGRDVIGSFAIVGALGQPPERTSHCAKKTWIVWRNHTFHYG